MSSPSPATLAQERGTARPISAMTTADWSVQVVTDDLSYPWDLNRAGNVIVMTEAAGNIVMIENGRLRRYAVQTSDPIVHDGGSGLLGMALSEDFQTSGLAYLYHSYRSASGLTNKVIEARFDGESWRETRVLLSGIPGHRLYNGGRIAIGPDGLLYVTTGWTENGALPQDLGSLAGKILRMTRDGHVPADNPFKGSYVYSYGHRNPQGLAWNDAGDLFVAEHGQSGHDEINLIKPGANYGWPLVSGGERRVGNGATRASLRQRHLGSVRCRLRGKGTACDGARRAWALRIRRCERRPEARVQLGRPSQGRDGRGARTLRHHHEQVAQSQGPVEGPVVEAVA